MSIRIDVKEYCGECCDFEPDITKPERVLLGDGKVITAFTDTIIRCKYRNRCEAIKRFIDRQKEADV